MQLDNIRNIVDTYDSIEPGSYEHEVFKAKMLKGVAILSKELPALSDSDRAAVAWYCAVMLGELLNVTLDEATETIKDSATGYALAAAMLLGWIA